MKNKDLIEKFKRERADFINYKKDESKRFKELLEYRMLDNSLSIIEIMDNFDLAEKSVKEQTPDIIGLLAIKKLLESYLRNNGIEKLDLLDKEYDPNTAEVIEGEGSIVKEVLLVAYKYKDKIIRPGKVKITK